MEQTAKSMGLLTDETEANTKASKENVITAQEVTASTKTTKEALDDLKETYLRGTGTSDQRDKRRDPCGTGRKDQPV